MKYLLMIIGYGWAALGLMAAIRVTIDLNTTHPGAPEEIIAMVDAGSWVGIVIYILLFIIPGLIIGGIGSNIRREK